jgi:hypothetical protein
MKPLRLASLLFATAIVLLSCAGNAWADTPTSPAGTAYTGKVHASSEGHVVIHNPAAKIECASTLESEVKAHGSGEELSLPLSSLTFTGCTNNWTATVNSPGTLEIHPLAGTRNGTVTWSGATISFFNSALGINCRYKTENTDIGTLTGSKTTGTTATIDLSAELPFHSGSPFCGSGAWPMTGSYSVGTPDYLDVDSVG